MKSRHIVWSLLIAGALALSTAAFAANPFSGARTVTRLVTSDAVPMSCSAVVIEPGVAMTAKHCTEVDKLRVDGKEVAAVAQHATQDVAKLVVPGLACPCVEVSTVRPTLDETMIAVGYLYGDMLVTSRGEYLGIFRNSQDGQMYGVFMGNAGPGMSGGGVFRVFVTGEIRLVGILSAVGPNGIPAIYVEVSKDALGW